MQNLSVNSRISRGATVSAGAAAQTTINGDWLDMAGMQSVLAMIPLGAIATGGVLSLKWQGASLNDKSDAADLQGTGQAFGDTDDDKVVFSEITPIPAHRWVRLVITRGTANSTVGGIQYLQFGARRVPVVHGANVVGELAIDPAAGVA